MANFHIGGKVIAIRNHPALAYKSGMVYQLTGVRKSLCKCPDVLLDIGLKNKYLYWVCDICNGNGKVPDSIFWATSADFLPYDDGISDITFEDIMQTINALS
jgi:hypothetical protein